MCNVTKMTHWTHCTAADHLLVVPVGRVVNMADVHALVLAAADVAGGLLGEAAHQFRHLKSVLRWHLDLLG